MKNYYHYSFFLSAAVLVLMSLVSFIAPATLGDVKLRQTNILGDVVSGEELRAVVGWETPTLPMANFVTLDIENILNDSIKELRAELRPVPVRRPVVEVKGLVAIEDFSDDGYSLAPFYEKLARAKTSGAKVRVAVMGDSFIEGDIMTCDLREMYQTAYSGAGVGFVPLSSQVAGFRATVKHRFQGITQHSLLKEGARGDYTLSGYTFTPAEGATVEYEGSKFRKHLARFTQARLVFVNRGSTVIKALINGSREVEFRPESSETLQVFETTDTISTIKYTFENVEGFTGYGVYLDTPRGVSVDNYSVRGNSGAPMARLNAQLCRELDRLEPTDLIILEYGLNVVSADVMNYNGYKKQMLQVIAALQAAFEGVPILMMGVSEQSIQQDGQFVTNPAVQAMDKAQRETAKTAGIAYWSTLRAMQQLGGMDKFVEFGWAAKDYTHVGTGGGRKIAQKLFEALEATK